jgi:hypothetical protein
VKLAVLVFLRFSFLWCSRSVEICRSQGVRSASIPVPASYPSMFLWLFSDCLVRKNFNACCLFRGLLARGSCSVLAVVPFAKIWTLFYFGDALTLHIFCNLVSRPYAGSLSCARDECLYCYDRLGLFRPGSVCSRCIPIWVVAGSGFMSPQSLYLAIFFNIFFLLLKKKLLPQPLRFKYLIILHKLKNIINIVWKREIMS